MCRILNIHKYRICRKDVIISREYEVWAVMGNQRIPYVQYGTFLRERGQSVFRTRVTATVRKTRGGDNFCLLPVGTFTNIPVLSTITRGWVYDSLRQSMAPPPSHKCTPCPPHPPRLQWPGLHHHNEKTPKIVALGGYF